MKKTIVKKILLASLLISAGFSSKAQTLDEAIKFYKFERYESARKILAPMSATNPLANYYLGLCELATEDTAGAKATFQKNADNEANMAGLARIYFFENKAPEAMSLLNKITSKVKRKEWAPYQYAADAITYSDGGDPNMAIDWYKKAMDVNKNGDLHIGLGDAYRKIQGGGGNAMNNFEYAENFPETKSLANYKMGSLWYAAKNYDSALSKYAQSSQLDAENPLPYKALADAYYRVGKYKISKENIEKYLSLSDKTIDDQIQYANTLYLSKEYPSAISKMNELISKGAEKPYMYRIIGYSQYETKDFANAKLNMDKFFAKQDPKKIIPQDYIYYGKILMTDSTTAPQANASFMKGIAIDTTADKAPLYRELGESYNDAKLYETSAGWYKKIIDENMPSIEPLDYWWSGVMFFYARDYDKAEGMLKTMSEKFPEEPSSYFWIGRVIATSKDKDYKNGMANDAFNKWIGMVDQAEPKKKNDLIKAYTYLAMVAYNNSKKEDAIKYSNKILSFDAQDKTAAQILKAVETMK